MADKLTAQEKEIFYDQSTDFDDYDPGVEAFSEAIRNAETFLNENGGYDSYSYGGTLIELNEKWENLDQTVHFMGKLYVVEEGMVELARGEWSEPRRDEQGTYFMVENAELVSLGVIDALAYDPGTVHPDGSVDRPVSLAYAFNVADMESDVPMFYAKPDDILRAKYELPTHDAVYSRLHHHWPKQMALIERRIDKAWRDPQRQVDLLRKVIQKESIQHACFDSDEFASMLAQYLYMELEHDKQWPYVVELEGPASVLDDDGEIQPVSIDSPLTAHMKVVGMDVLRARTSDGKNAEIGLVFASPNQREDEEGVDTRIIAPLSSIRSITSSRPSAAFTEMLASGIRDQTPATGENGQVSPMDSSEEKELPARLVEFRRLEKLDQLLKEMTMHTQQLRRKRFSDHDTALEATHMLAKMFFEQMNALGLKDTDHIQVSGHGVIKGNATFTTGYGKFHLDIDTEQPLVTPMNASDTVGSYESFLVETDQFEDEEGRPFWQVAPKLIIKTRDTRASLVQYNYPLLSAAVKSNVSARLDDSVTFSVPHYERMKQRHETLAAIALSHREDRSLSDLKGVNQAFLHEQPDSFVDGKRAVQRIRRLARSLQETPDDVVLAALRQQLLDRKVQMVGDTQMGVGRSEAYFNVGTVTDVFEAELPDGSREIVAALANDEAGNDQERAATVSRLVILRTLESLQF